MPFEYQTMIGDLNRGQVKVIYLFTIQVTTVYSTSRKAWLSITTRRYTINNGNDNVHHHWFLITAVCDVKTAVTASRNCPFRGHSIMPCSTSNHLIPMQASSGDCHVKLLNASKVIRLRFTYLPQHIFHWRSVNRKLIKFQPPRWISTLNLGEF